MKKITRWLREFALAQSGFDPDNIGNVKLVEAHAQKVGLAETLHAMEALGHNYDLFSPAKMAEVMTTAQFSTYFSAALSRKFYNDYMYRVGSWKNYTYADSAPDFRDVSRFRMSEPETLVNRREKAEAKATYIEASRIQWGVDEFARQFDVSWRTIMNDDLGKIKETPMRMLNAALRFEDAWVSNLYDNAVTQATLAALGAPWSGTGRLTAANLAIGINAMATRTDAQGNQMNIRNIHLVIPTVLKIQADTILESVLVAGVATNDKNVLNRYIAGVHVDPYIATAGINIPWYLFADPSEIPTVTVGRLDGFNAPFVTKKRSDIEMVSGSAPQAFQAGSFATGDIEYMVEDIIGGWDDASYVGVTDFRGIYYSSGTTP
jgi:hypothetical protein